MLLTSVSRYRIVSVLILGTVVTVAATLLCTAFAISPEQLARARAGELVIGFQDDAQNLDPRKARISPDLRVTTLIHSALLRATSSGLVPDLAESWELPDPSTYVFHLRSDVHFQDGSALTASDVKYTYDTIRDPAFGSPDLGTFAAVEDIETPDPQTVIFHLKKPNVALLAELNKGIVSQAYAEANPAAANLEPLGSGPYKFVEWVPNTRIVLEANPDYFGGQPPFKKITFIPIVDNNVRSLRFEAGAIDLLYTAGVSDVTRLRDMADVNVYTVPGTTADFIQINTCNEPLSDVNVRRAIDLAIDRSQIVEGVYFGGAQPGTSPIVPSSAFHNADLQPTTRDVVKAKQLLADAGYPDGITITLEQLAETTVNQYSQLVQAQLAEAGIMLNLEPREAATIIRDWTTANYQLMSFQLGARFDPDTVLYPRFHSSSKVPNGNNTCYENADVDQLLDAARSETDDIKRHEMYARVQEVLASELPILILTYRPEFVVAPAELQDLSYDPFSFFFNVATGNGWQIGD